MQQRLQSPYQTRQGIVRIFCIGILGRMRFDKMVYPVFILVQKVHEVIHRSLQKWIDLVFQCFLVATVLIIAIVIEHGPDQVSGFKLAFSKIVLVQWCMQIE